MSDQEKLREAIRFLQPWHGQISAFVGNFERDGYARTLNALRAIIDAAEKTLPPKPQTVWDLTASGRSYAPYESQRVIFEAAEIGGCIESLHGEGFQRVLVTAREVPA